MTCNIFRNTYSFTFMLNIFRYNVRANEDLQLSIQLKAGVVFWPSPFCEV